MWDVDNFPGAGNVPWQLLIRARVQREIDAAVATAVTRIVGQCASAHVAARVARAAVEGVSGGPVRSEPTSSDQRANAIVKLIEFDDYCGTGVRQFHPPHPHGSWLDEFGEASAAVVLPAAVDLVRAVGSDHLVATLGAALQPERSQKLAAVQ